MCARTPPSVSEQSPVALDGPTVVLQQPMIYIGPPATRCPAILAVAPISAPAGCADSAETRSAEIPPSQCLPADDGIIIDHLTTVVGHEELSEAQPDLVKEHQKSGCSASRLHMLIYGFTWCSTKWRCEIEDEM